MKIMRLYLAKFFTLLLITSLAFLISIDPSYACRDCPFPMKIGDGRWLMPNERLEVVFLEVNTKDHPRALVIVLIDSETGKTVASGSARLSQNARNYRVILFDHKNNPIKADVQWLGRDMNQVQIQLNCINQCTIQNLL